MNTIADKDGFNDLEWAIISTIAYFDIFSYPVTATEIWKWLYTENSKYHPSTLLRAGIQNPKFSIHDVIQSLENSEKINKFTSHQNGFYFLKGREETLQTRHRRYLIGQPKWKKARWITKILRCVPFVKMIAVCNKIAYDNADNDSDIDLFIIIKPGRIWTARIIITVITSLLGVRRHQDKIKDRACLSFYITTRALDLEKLAGQESDTHFMYWTTQIAPLFSIEGLNNKFFAANNWIRRHLPNFIPYQGIDFQRHLPDNGLTHNLRKALEKILTGTLGNYLETRVKKTQLGKMDKKTTSVRWQNNTNVVVTDDVLKFHERDARGKCRKEFLDKLEMLSN